ncbi:antichymotrypsin-1-like [Battus philenor]|uniref:antichymotrypsin-1-like n=1 Tax=Battus philenor TaxID=42288 RepID=UPI0035CFB087
MNRNVFYVKDIYDVSDDKNVIASPLGVFTLLSLYSAATTGDSREQLVKYLGLPDYTQQLPGGSCKKNEDIKKNIDADADSNTTIEGEKQQQQHSKSLAAHRSAMTKSYKNLTQRFITMDPKFLTLANKVCVSNDYQLKEDFRNIVTRDYHSEVDSVDFKNPRGVVEMINRWADQKTRGHIKQPVSEELFTSETAAALFNVIFFQGHWHVPFEKADTVEKNFHISESNTVQKPTMHLLQSLYYHEDKVLGARMIELPYKESDFRMIVVLPDAVDGLPAVMDKLAQKGILENVFAMRTPGREIDLDMPKFDVKSKNHLKSILMKEGVTGIFLNGARGVVKDKSLLVSKVFQEAFVKVDEEGATAGAFTGIVLLPISTNSKPPSPIQFKVDRPFLYAILHKDVVLFVGTYTH